MLFNIMPRKSIHMLALGVSLMLLMQTRAVSSLQPSDGMKIS